MKMLTLLLAIMFVFSFGFLTNTNATTVGEFLVANTPMGTSMENNLPDLVFSIPLPDTFPDTGGGTTDPGDTLP